MDERCLWMKSRRKKRLRIMAVMLSFCLLFTTCPEILDTVSVFASELETVIQALLDCITALPDVQEYMAKEPDIDNWEGDDDAYEEAYEEWMEGFSAYAEEALAIWEEYEALTQEQQAQIPEELLTKLTVWVELAEQAAGSRKVMAAASGDLKGHTNHSGWTVLYSYTNLSQGRNYYLTSDIGSITIPEGLTVNVCLNGHKMSGITVESGATLNLYDCQGGGMISRTNSPGSSGNAVIDASGDGITVNLYGGTISGTNYRGIDASGTGTTVNLYGGTVSVENSSGVKLENGAHLLVDGAEVKSEVTKRPNGLQAAVDIRSGASAEIKSGSVFMGNTAQASNVAIIYVDGGSLIVSGGTVEGAGRSVYEPIWIDWGTADNYEDSHIEINGGTINARAVIRRGNLVVNNTKIGGLIELEGVLQLKGVQSIGSAEPESPNILFYVNRNAGKTGIIELAGPLANQEPYTLQFLDISSSSKYPFTVTKNFSNYMSGKEPTAYFTYLSSGKKEDHYKIILQGGEVVLFPYVMTFDANGGKLEDSTEYKHVITNGKGDITGGNYMRALPDPTRDGYDFDGWYTQKEGGTEVTIDNEPIEEDITVYAHWTPIEYPITYDLNGGTLPTGKTNPETYNIESANFTLNNPSRTGYTFTGWSGTGLTGTTNKTVTVKKGSMGDCTYTANWKAADYTVTLNGNGGSAGTTLTGYTYGVGATLPTNWTKTGYTFGGWYEKSDFSGTAVKNITTTDTGNKTYYAKWTANTYIVTFNYQSATGGNSETNRTVTYDSTYGTVSGVSKSLPSPTKTGYTFKGWYTQAGGKGSKITDTTTVNITAAQTLYAYWKDETAPDAPVLQTGMTLPAGWTNTQDTIPLKLHDGVAVTELWVSVDGGTYTKVTEFSSGSTEYSYAVTEGEHTYLFKAKDAAGNTSKESAAYKVILDKTKPVIGTLTYENQAKNFLDWIIGKKSLIIKVPVTDEGSGVTQISFCMTAIDAMGSLDNDSTVTKTAPVENGKAQITFSEDFRGRIVITCADTVGNTSDSVTVDTEAGANGLIVEDRAPEISMLADRTTSDITQTRPDGAELSEAYYESVPAIIVTVKDDINNAITAGVDDITYQIGDSPKKAAAVDTSTLQTEVTFTIPASEIPTGITVIRIAATDNAGNEVSKSITVKVKGPEKKPAAKIGYLTEKLNNLEPGADYQVNDTSYTADEEGCIPIDDSWFDTTVSIVKRGNGIETLDSSEQSLAISARPDAPDAPVFESRTDGSITLQTITGAQYRTADVDWQEGTVFTGLDEKTIYFFEARYPAKENSFASLPSSRAQIATMPKPPAADELVVDYIEETFVPKDGVEVFTDQECTTGASAGDVTAYMGQTIYIRYSEKGTDGIIPASLTTTVQIPERPDRPNAGSTDATYPNAEDGTVTGLTEGTAYEFRVKDADDSFGPWEDAVLNGTKIENLPAGEYEVRLKAVENVSFRSEAASVTIGEIPSTQYETPDVQIDYINEELTGFVTDAQYSIKYVDQNGTEQAMDSTAVQDGVLALKEEWLGTTFTIIRNGNGKDKTDSDAQNLLIPQRPQKPAPVGVDVSAPGGTGKLIGLTADTAYEISTDDGKTWESKTANGSGEITGLAPGNYTVRIEAGTSNFAGLPSDLSLVDDYKVTVTFVANGETYKTFSVYYGGELKDIPSVPEKKDAGDRTYTGAWCSDEQGTPADFTNITADMTVYAVYTAYYSVTMEDGTGYILSAQEGSVSSVIEGGSFTFKFMLGDGYEKTESFAVKVNGVKVELTADDTYTITGIMEDKTVTVEGVQKTASPGGTEDSDNAPVEDPNDNPTRDDNEPTDSNPSTDDNSIGDDNEPTDSNLPTDDNTSTGGTAFTGGNMSTDSNTSTGGTAPTGGNTSTDSNTSTGGTAPTGTNLPTDENTPTDGNSPAGSNMPDSEEIQVVPVIIEDDNIVISGEPGAIAESGIIMAGGVNGMTTVSTILQVGDGNDSSSAVGAVIVTVVCEEEKYAAGVMDAAAVANIVLTPDQIQLVSDGETIEVRIDVKDISETVAGQDKEVIEDGLGVYRKELPGLTLGMYVDISMFIRAGEGDWDVVTSTDEPIEVVIGIPEELKEDGREFYIIRAHEGEYTLLQDLDNDPNTITISTDRFSSYAIAYEETDGAGGTHKCGLCHICPTFLGVCCFIWLAVIVAVILEAVILVLRRKKD